MSSVSSTSSSSSILQNYINSNYSTTSSTVVSSSSDSTSLASVTSDFDTFLKILTTQLQNQDPTAAMDTNQFTQELVEFSGVSQQIETNAKLDSILSSIQSNGITPALDYVGKTIEVNDDSQIVLQDGVADFSYTLPSEATTVTLKIKDSDGNTVCSVSGTTTSGVNRVAWDGSCDDGKTASSGVYTVSITAKDSSGNTITATDINAIAKVTSVQVDSSTGDTTVSMGDFTVPLSDIVAVYGGVTTNSSSNSSSSSSSSS